MRYICVRAKYWGYPSDDTWGDFPTGNALIQLMELNGFETQTIYEETIYGEHLWDAVEAISRQENIPMPRNLADIIFQTRGVTTLRRTK